MGQNRVPFQKAPGRTSCRGDLETKMTEVLNGSYDYRARRTWRLRRRSTDCRNRRRCGLAGGHMAANMMQTSITLTNVSAGRRLTSVVMLPPTVCRRPVHLSPFRDCDLPVRQCRRKAHRLCNAQLIAGIVSLLRLSANRIDLAENYRGIICRG